MQECDLGQKSTLHVVKVKKNLLKTYLNNTLIEETNEEKSCHKPFTENLLNASENIKKGR